MCIHRASLTAAKAMLMAWNDQHAILQHMTCQLLGVTYSTIRILGGHRKTSSSPTTVRLGAELMRASGLWGNM